MKLEVIKMFADNIAQFGTVRILVNNAGLQRNAKFVDMTLEQWNFVLAVNLTGQFLCAREAIKGFMRIGIDEKRAKPQEKYFDTCFCFSWHLRCVAILSPFGS